MKTATIAKFLLEQEDIVTLKDWGLKFDEKTIPIGRTKVPSYIFYNVTESEIFDYLDSASVYKFTLSEAGDTLQKTFVSRAWSVIFTQINRVNKLPNDGSRVAAVCSLLATCVSMADLDTNLASRMLQLIRNL